MEDTIEKRVVDTILQRASVSLEIEGRQYPVAPASPATVILVSELVAQMPEIDPDADHILFETLRTAKDTAVVGKIAAVLILGAKRIRERRVVTIARTIPFKKFSFRKMRKITAFKIEEEEVDELEYLTELVLHNCSNHTLKEVIAQRLIDMEISDFFGLTTSLSAANHLKRTREVETATAFGD